MKNERLSFRWMASLGALVLATTVAAPAGAFEAGAAKRELTPKTDKPVFMAGFGNNRTATGVHDPVWVRCLAISDGANMVAFVGLDFIGFFYEPDVAAVRELVQNRVQERVAVLIASTHNHEGPDTLGMWGATVLQTGRDESYMAWVREQIADCVAEAVPRLEPAWLTVARDDRAELANLQSDSRLPSVKDHTLHVLQAVSQKTGKTIGTLVNWANHPEVLGPRNKLLSADYCDALCRRMEELLGGVAVFWNGAIGGLISPGNAEVVDPTTGEPAAKASFRKAELIGRFIAEVAVEAARRPDAVRLEKGSLQVSLCPLFVPLQATRFRVAAGMGIAKRPVYTDGKLDDRVTEQEVTIEGFKLKAPAAMGQDVRTEVGVVTVTDANGRTPAALFLLVPGEIYPELVYGGITRYPGADFPDAPMEPVLMEPARETGAKFTFVVGLANDEIGYIIPQCEWDEAPPWLNNAPRKPYGEINSLGWKAARCVNEALLAVIARGMRAPQGAARPPSLPRASGVYEGMTWEVDGNHMLWWEGQSYSPYASFGIGPNNHLGITEFNPWKDNDLLIADPRLTRAQHIENTRHRLQAIAKAGRTCLPLLAIASPLLPDGCCELHLDPAPQSGPAFPSIKNER